MTDEQFDRLSAMLEAIHATLREVVTENQMATAQLGDIFAEIQRGLTEIE